jgi:hypothetical protein
MKKMLLAACAFAVCGSIFQARADIETLTFDDLSYV